jgi:transcriptional regulator with XRE-family HTH domain
MDRKTISEEKPHYLAEHLEIRRDGGWDQARLAREIGTSETNISRWAHFKRGLPHRERRKIEILWGLPVNGLLRPPGEPTDATPDAFLAGLSERSRHLLIEQRDHLRAVEGNRNRRSRRKP